MKTNLLLSVVVTTYNHRKYIKECLDSILKQKTNFSFEILIGEDDSTDGTREFCKQYTKKYPNIINLFLRKRKDVIYINGNPTGRFNFLQSLKACKGKYIALCEGDDYWTDPLKLQKQVDFMEANPEYHICFHNAQIFDQKSKKLKKNSITRKVSNTTNISDLARGNYIQTPTVLFRKNFEEVPDWFVKSPLGDWTLYMLVTKYGKIYKMNDSMAVYRHHDESIWSQKSKFYRIANTLKSFELVVKNIVLPEEIKNILKEKIVYFKKQLIK